MPPTVQAELAFSVLDSDSVLRLEEAGNLYVVLVAVSLLFALS